MLWNCKSVVLFSECRVRDFNKLDPFKYKWFTEYTANMSIGANNMRIEGEFYYSTIQDDNSCFLERRHLEGPRLFFDINRWCDHE